MPDTTTLLNINADAVLHNADARKDAEVKAKQLINAIWQKLDSPAEWPLAKIEALTADLKRHL